MLIAEPRSNLLQNSKILDWLDACVDHLTESSNLESLDWIGWDESSGLWIDLLNKLADGKRLSQNYVFVRKLGVVDDQCWHELQCY